MTIKPVENQKTWEEFALSQKPNIFLQSWNWGQFHQNLGEKIFRLGFWEGKKLTGLALLIKEEAKRGTYLSCPGGPLIDWQKESHFKIFVDQLKKIGRQERVVFVRIRPSLLSLPENKKLFKKAGFFPAPMHMHAETTWQLDLTPSQAELLKKMRKSTRYSLKRAQKEGVKIETSQDSKDIDLLYRLQIQTARRHHFVPFSREFLKEQFKTFAKDNQALLFLARYRNQVQAASLIIFYGDTAVYHYSGSSPRFPQIPSSHLIQWEAIKEAQKRGCRVYNFWGIAPTANPRHRFAGVTTFKKGFGGYRVDYLHAQDLPLKKQYSLTFAFETARRLSRRL